jgi:hypothetical protein
LAVRPSLGKAITDPSNCAEVNISLELLVQLFLEPAHRFITGVFF